MEIAATTPVAPSAEQLTASEMEIDSIDFDSLFGDLEPVGEVESPPAVELLELDEPALPKAGEVAPATGVSAPEYIAAEATVVESNEDEQIKFIGTLRIGIPLYNVYLNEADEWSRRLVTEVSEWAMERHHPVSDSTVALAHSLAGSSATVGFVALSETARALEHALQQSRAHHGNGAATYGQLFVDAAEDIRRLLHQFAAGFLKEADAGVLERLKQLEFSDSVLPPTSGYSDLDFAGELTQADEADAELAASHEAVTVMLASGSSLPQPPRHQRRH